MLLIIIIDILEKVLCMIDNRPCIIVYPAAKIEQIPDIHVDVQSEHSDQGALRTSDERDDINNQVQNNRCGLIKYSLL